MSRDVFPIYSASSKGEQPKPGWPALPKFHYTRIPSGAKFDISQVVCPDPEKSKFKGKMPHKEHSETDSYNLIDHKNDKVYVSRMTRPEDRSGHVILVLRDNKFTCYPVSVHNARPKIRYATLDSDEADKAMSKGSKGPKNRLLSQRERSKKSEDTVGFGDEDYLEGSANVFDGDDAVGHNVVSEDTILDAAKLESGMDFVDTFDDDDVDGLTKEEQSNRFMSSYVDEDEPSDEDLFGRGVPVASGAAVKSEPESDSDEDMDNARLSDDDDDNDATPVKHEKKPLPSAASRKRTRTTDEAASSSSTKRVKTEPVAVKAEVGVVRQFIRDQFRHMDQIPSREITAALKANGLMMKKTALAKLLKELCKIVRTDEGLYCVLRKK